MKHDGWNLLVDTRRNLEVHCQRVLFSDGRKLTYSRHTNHSRADAVENLEMRDGKDCSAECGLRLGE